VEFNELSNEQRRQLIDVLQAYAAWRPAATELEGMGTMRVQVSKGRRYVYEVRSTVRKSLGQESLALRKRKAAHDARRKELQTRVRSLQAKLDAMAPVNRALRLGRLPTIAARIIRAIDREGLLGTHVMIAGTNALFAFEVATGTVIEQEHVATTDADILWDPRQSLLLAATGVRREGLMGILRSVDRSFEADYGFNAKNRDGYIVDLICPPTDQQTTMAAGADLEAVQMEGIEWLLAAPHFEQVVIAEDGLPARMVVPDPRTFALHKLWVSRRQDRQPVKRPRDKAHAAIVAQLATKYLNQRMVTTDMPWLPSELRALVRDAKALR